MKKYMPKLLEALTKAVNSRDEFTIWTPNELIIEMNKHLGFFKLSSVSQIGRIMTAQRKFRVFKWKGNSIQYIFIKV